LRNYGKVYENFDNPCVITNIIAPSCYEISDKEGKMRGTVNKAPWRNRELTEYINKTLNGDSDRSERDI